MFDLFDVFNVEAQKEEPKHKMIRVKENYLYILDEEIQKKIDKIKLSPSFVNSFLSSPGDAILNKFILPEIQLEEPIYFARGKWFHSIMEDFFKKPAYRRTYEDLKKSVSTATKEGNYTFLLDDEENKNWLRMAIKNYKETWLPNAKNEKIANLFIQGRQQIGIELFISGKLGNCKRQSLGFIDKIVEGEKGLIVQDWKTGKKISNFNPDKKISDSNPFDYWRQQTFYSLLLEQNGAVIEGACLIFPCSEPPQIVEVNQADKDVRKQVIHDFETVDKVLEESINNNYCFEFKKGLNNGWATFLCGLGSAYKPSIKDDLFYRIAEIEGV